MRLRGIKKDSFPDKTKVVAICYHCNRIVCDGETDINNTNDKGHVTLFSNKIRRSQGYRHSCALYPLDIKDRNFAEFYYELLLK